MSLALTKLSETSTKITLGWAPVPGCVGYVFFADDKRVSNTWDPAKSSVTFSKGATRYRVDAVGVEDSGVWPDTTPPPPTGLGEALRKPLPRPTGTPLAVYTWGQLTTALADTNIRRIQIADTISNQGDLYVTRRASDTAPLWIHGGKTAGIRWLPNGCRNVIFEGIEVAGGHDGFKFTGGASRCEVYRCNVHDSAYVGINNHGGASDLLIHANTVWHNGFTGTELTPQQRHGMYIGDCDGFSIYNNYCYDNSGYHIQIYPSCTNGQVWCNTNEGGYARGGIVEGSPGPHSIGGNIIENTPVYQGEQQAAFMNYGGRTIYDSIERNTGGFQGGSFVHCVEGDPKALQRNFVPTERHKFVPPTWMDGAPRGGGHAGAFAA